MDEKLQSSLGYFLVLRYDSFFDEVSLLKGLVALDEHLE
jgi:hypothetical protein